MAKLPRRNGGMFSPPRHKDLAKIVTFESISAARKAAATLLKMFKSARTKKRKVTIKRATVLAANRARVLARSHRIHASTKKRLREIARIYERAAEKMVLD